MDRLIKDSPSRGTFFKQSPNACLIHAVSNFHLHTDIQQLAAQAESQHPKDWSKKVK